MARREYSGAAAPTKLASTINGTATTFTVATGTGASFPAGSTGSFVVLLDRGLASEEKVLCSSRSGDVFTVSQRGFDGTVASSHGVVENGVEHVVDAESLNEVQAHVFNAAAHVTDHGNLSGLTDDDHTQYIRVSGSRPFSGSQSFGGNKITNLGYPTAGTHGATAGYVDLVATQTVDWSFAGDVEVKVGQSRWHPPPSPGIEIIGVGLSAGTAPLGSTLIVDVNKNGTSIRAAKFVLSAGSKNTGSQEPDGAPFTMLQTDYLTVDVDQVGSTTPGADLLVQVYYVVLGA